MRIELMVPVEAVGAQEDSKNPTFTLTQWHILPGTRVCQDDPLFAFEAGKGNLNFLAPQNGVLTEIRVPASEDEISVHAVVGIFESDE